MSIIFSHLDVVVAGLELTLLLTLIGIVGAFVVGTAVGALYSSGDFFVRKLAGSYIDVMRNIPIVVKLFFLYFVLGLDAFPAAVIALVTHQSGFIADVVAAGFRSVPREQAEGARASGLSPVQVFGHVVFPQAIRFVMPPMTSQFIELAKNTSVVMLIGMQDLTYVSENIQTETFHYLQSFVMVTILYMLIMLAISAAMSALNRRMWAYG